MNVKYYGSSGLFFVDIYGWDLWIRKYFVGNKLCFKKHI
jgi:hypothetical protein